MRSLCIAALLTAFAPLIADAGTPHPFHTSIAEVEYNPETKRFEVALKLYAVDAESALSKINGKACDLDDAAQRDRLMQRYLTTRFRTDVATKNALPPAEEEPKKKPAPKPALRYIGSELAGANVWAYFELPAQGAGEFVLRNEVLVEVQRQQLNMVRFKGPAGAQTLYFNRNNKTCSLSLTKRVQQKPISGIK